MKNKYILLFLFGFFGIHASAQTLAQAKILYEKGQYEHWWITSVNNTDGYF